MDEAVRNTAHELLTQHQLAVHSRTDRMFAVLMTVQWAVGVGVAWLISPLSWAGKSSQVHVHVLAAVLLGGLITSAPVVLALTRPGWVVTRNVVACGQMLWSALLIHLTGGRIETHFLIFGSLAFLGLYREWRIFIPATLVVVIDHALRQFFWPESVFGIASPEWWRFLEHAFYVVFEDVVLIIGCLATVKEMTEHSHRQAELEASRLLQREKTEALDQALDALRKSQAAMVRTEKLAAVGKLAASVGHELRNPLAAIRSANTYVTKKLSAVPAVQQDAKVNTFFGIIDRELDACSHIISDLLDFARERTPELRPAPLATLMDDALAVVPRRDGVAVVNEVPGSLAVPLLDKEQFRQVIINLVQNAVEAIPSGRSGRVAVSASGGGDDPWLITIADDGVGISAEVQQEIFQPLFTTKTKGTGLGLAVVWGVIDRHKGRIWVESQVGVGTRFFIELPKNAPLPAAFAMQPSA